MTKIYSSVLCLVLFLTSCSSIPFESPEISDQVNLYSSEVVSKASIRINLGGNAVVSDGKSFMNFDHALNNGLTVDQFVSVTTEIDPIPTVSGGTINLLNSGISNPGGDLNLHQKITNGKYQVYLYEMETISNHARSLNVFLENQIVAASVGYQDYANWEKVGPYNITVFDGTLDIKITKSIGDPILMGLEMIPGGSGQTTASSLKIMPLGDSITYGVNSSDVNGYRKSLYDDLLDSSQIIQFVGSLGNGGFEQPQNEGHPGFTIGNISDNIKSWLPAAQPSQILLMIGTNDVIWLDDPDHAADRLGTLIDQIFVLLPNVKILVSDILPIPTMDPTFPCVTHIPSCQYYVNEFNAAIPEIVKARKLLNKSVSYVEMHDVVPIEDITDGIHPNDEGYGKMADRWFEAIKKFF